MTLSTLMTPTQNLMNHMKTVICNNDKNILTFYDFEILGFKTNTAVPAGPALCQEVTPVELTPSVHRLRFVNI